MKGRRKKLLALFLAAGLFMTQLPASMVVQAEPGINESRQENEPEGITDDTVVVTTDWDYYNEHNTACVYLENSDVAQKVAEYLGKTGDEFTITYGEVKEITSFEFVSQDGNYGGYIDDLSIILPNVQTLRIDGDFSIGNDLGEKLTDLTIEMPEGKWFDLDSLAKVASKLKRFSLKCYNAVSFQMMEQSVNWSDFVNLESLSLKLQSYEDGDLAEIVSLTKLTDFRLSGVDGNNDLSFISKISNLTKLDLSGNDWLTKLPDLSNLTKLQSLNVSNCDLSVLPDLKGLSSLENLNIINNKKLIKSLAIKSIPEKFANDAEWVADNFVAQNEVVTTGDKESEYYIPDQNLYAIILKEADQNKDSILTVGEAWGLTYFSPSWEDMEKVENFDGLSTVLKNLYSINVNNYNYYSEKTEASFVDELCKLEKLADLYNLYINQQSSFEQICSNLTGLTYLSVYSDLTLDCSKISNLKQLSDLRLNAKVTNYEKLNQLTELNWLQLSNAESFDFSKLQDTLERLEYLWINAEQLSSEQIAELTAAQQLRTLHLNIGTSEAAVACVDVSKFINLEDLEVYGNIQKVILPENTEKLRDLQLVNWYGSSLGTVENLSNTTNLGYCRLENYELKNLQSIGKNTKIYNLDLESCGLEDLSGIGSFTELSYLEINNNDSLKTIPEEIGNLQKLNSVYIRNNANLESIGNGFSKLEHVSYLDLSYNALTTLPDLSKLCTKDALLYEQDYNSWNFNKRLVLTGNYLTKEAILSANLTEDFTGDANWMIYSTARRLSNGNTYYPELTEAYMLYCMEHNISSWFSCGEELTLSEEFLNYIKEEDKSLGIQIYDKDLKYYTGYYFSADRLKDWDGNPVKLTGNRYEELDTAQYAKFFTKEPVRAYKVNKLDDNVSNYLDGSGMQITGLDKGLYQIYRFDETTQQCSEYSSFTINDNNGSISYGCTEGIYLVTDAETANSHNIKGVYSGKMSADTTGYTLIGEINWTDNSSEYVINPEFKVLVEQAPANSTIKGYLKSGWYQLDTDVSQLIKDKNITLEVMFCDYSRYWSGEEYNDYLTVDCIEKVDAEMVYSIGYIGYSSIYFDNYETPYAPSSLLNGIDRTWRQSRDGKYYVGNKYTNGTKFYVYNCNREKREYELLDEVEVAFGYVDLKSYEVDSCLLTDTKLERTTWTADEEYTYTPPTKTDGDADKKTDGDADKKPDDTETPSTPDTPNEPDVPSTPDKPSEPEIPSTPDTPNNSGKTDTPETPVTPVTPDVPNDNVTPETPATPDTPSDTETPDTPDVPGDTETPDTPDVPGDTETPETPDVSDDTETPDNSQENNSDNNESNDNSGNQNSNVTGSVSVDDTTIIDKVPDNIVLPTIKQTVITNEKGKASAPSKVKASSIVKKENAVQSAIDKMSKTILPRVEVMTQGSLPTMGADLFEAAKKNNKDITFGATDANNNLLYSWTFDYTTLDPSKIAGKTMDLSISFATDKQKEIEEITGQTNSVYISIDGYHGELPGPATVKTYVGDNYVNGDIVYLYYYNEETKQVELAGGSGLVVEGGYVTYTLTHCSVYFLSQDTPETYGIDTSKLKTGTAVNTGDNNNMAFPIVCALFGLGCVAYAVRRKKYM